jgi:hypothetical protein
MFILIVLFIFWLLRSRIRIWNINSGYFGEVGAIQTDSVNEREGIGLR